jgi:hypothetical protein
VQSALASRLVLHLRTVREVGESANSEAHAQTPAIRLRDMKSPPITQVSVGLTTSLLWPSLTLRPLVKGRFEVVFAVIFNSFDTRFWNHLNIDDMHIDFMCWISK